MKTISVKVKARAKENSVREKDGFFMVSVTEPAIEGRANEAVINMLAEYFNISKNGMRIRLGLNSRTKVIEIM